MADNLQMQRFELKYLLPEETALRVRDFVSSYLEIDEYGATMPNLSYPVHSLYIDSPQLDTYWWTINGNKNRYKLRLRYYNDKPDAPVFFEIKRRANNTILKARGGVRRPSVASILSGHLPAPSEVLSKDPRHYNAICKFCEHMLSMNGRPTSHVFYMREAWISTMDNSVRVTMDREVQCEPDPTARCKVEMYNPVRPFGKEVILELKFTTRFPDWFKLLVRRFDLMQMGAAKYAMGIMLTGETNMRNAFAFDGQLTRVKVPVSANDSNSSEAPAGTEPALSAVK